MSLPDNLARSLRRPLRLLARPARAAAGRSMTIQSYRGYGTPREVFLMGRVFHQPGGVLRPHRRGLVRDLIDTAWRFLRWGAAGASVTARFGGTDRQTVTDGRGYFRLRMQPAGPPPAGRLWHRMDLETPGPAGTTIRAKGELFIPPESCRFVVISDIDDTVVHTGVANKAMMVYRLFFQPVHSRVAFPGVAALYRALHRGPSGDQLNPMLYVSRGPWSLYEVLDEFFHIHDIPVGPILFLRDWGLTLQRPLPPRAAGHKLDLIRGMLSLYDRLPFVLIGDSGQRDPEIYAQIVREHPGRVRAVYVRNVSRDPRRRRAIEDLAVEVAQAGSSLLLAADSFAMAQHAATHDLISSADLREVLAERTANRVPAGDRPSRAVVQPTRAATREAVQRGDLEEALAQPTRDDAPPSVTVEPEDRAKPEPPAPDSP